MDEPPALKCGQRLRSCLFWSERSRTLSCRHINSQSISTDVLAVWLFSGADTNRWEWPLHADLQSEGQVRVAVFSPTSTLLSDIQYLFLFLLHLSECVSLRVASICSADPGKHAIKSSVPKGRPLLAFLLPTQWM